MPSIPPRQIKSSPQMQEKASRTIDTFKDITALARCSISTRDYLRNGACLAHGETT